jgi:hypothetical protein
MGNDSQTQAALTYVKQHGGGTIAVSSQSSAAPAIIASGAKVAGIGGFSGRESDVAVSWLAQRVRSGEIRWVLAEQSSGFGGRAGMPGDTRAGSKAAMTAVSEACRKVTLSSGTGGATTSSAGASGQTGAAGTLVGGGSSTASASSLYDCQGRASALESAGG